MNKIFSFAFAMPVYASIPFTSDPSITLTRIAVPAMAVCAVIIIAYVVYAILHKKK